MLQTIELRWRRCLALETVPSRGGATLTDRQGGRVTGMAAAAPVQCAVDAEWSPRAFYISRRD